MKIAYLAIPVLALSACAAIHSQEAADSEVLLNQAGFQKRAEESTAGASTAGQDVGKVPARQIVESTQSGTPMYTFADPDNCHCLYVGGEQEYAKLQKLRQQRLDDHLWYTRQSTFEGGISNLWGPWEPQGLQVKGTH
jgi:hypothetical protein